MFNFHKPRVYRSADGCCICRAKSSSSRFTASRKYEKESMQCFNLHEPRNGEICNACVLLVKRFKRLPPDSKRHWGHVVDARAGPGMKSLAKQKKRENESGGGDAGSSSSFIPEKFAKIFKKNRKGKITTTSAGNGGVAAAAGLSSINPSSPNGCISPNSELQAASDSNESYEDEEQQQQQSGATSVVGGPYQTRKRTAAAAALAKLGGSKRRRQLLPPKKHRRAIDNVPFFEDGDLIRLEICCGIIFQSLALGNSCYIIDPDLYTPCEKHLRKAAAASQSTQLDNNASNQISSHQQQLQEQNGEQQQQSQTQTHQEKPVKVLKKHHLFFKRQSESFPQGDIHRISPIPLNKTEVRPLPISGHSTVGGGGGGVGEGGSATTTTAIGAASPSSLSSSSNCSTSSSVATKFNDNSSDSGFDEHVLERRKSVSPPTQDELKSRVLSSSSSTTSASSSSSSSSSSGGMQRLVLASGLPITGQAQNLVLAGNEFTARFVQQRQQQVTVPATAAIVEGTTLKINVLGGGSQAGVGGGGNSNNNTNTNTNTNKMRAIFNNVVSSSNATIQHENGVTTILPASSLAASNQTAAMNAIAPSMVTITPAKKSIGQSNQPSSTTTTATATTTTLMANPKFILLKSAKFIQKHYA
ncbi:uncharacterized protein Dwil_GK25625 [Drosophila willistoni]|uniref:Protein FAM60A n=1 Tax=Drosophila willistoni TaxID=7260 RepID=B4NEC9_DROWI|nr:uncharacterized protein Dwil_GK25625 [Drosophila willistoni]